MPVFAVNANAAFDDYDELVDAINDWMDRDDLSGVAPQMIALAEDEMRLRLEPLFHELTVSVTTDETGAATLPTDLKRVERVLYDNKPLYQRGKTAVNNMTEDVSCPHGYTLEGGQIRLWPAAEHTVTILYTQLLTRLTRESPTNALLDLFPSVYFYGAMTFAEGYVAEDEGRKAEFRALFDNILNQAADYYRKQRYGGPLVARVPFVP